MPGPLTPGALVTLPAVLLLASYLLLVGGVVLLLTACGETPGGLRLARWGAAAPAPAACRLHLVALLAALAGLPPFFYFFAKLGVIAVVAGAGNAALTLGLAGLISLAWAVYLRAALLILRGGTTLAGSPLWGASWTPLWASGLVLAGLGTLLLGVAFEDLYVLGAYAGGA